MSAKRSVPGAATAASLPQTDNSLVEFPAPETKQPPAPDDRFEHVPLSVLYESNTNPRRNFDDKSIADLAGNLRLHGVLEPLIVRHRPVEGTKLYEIVAGARRFRAASAASLDTLPVIVKRNLSDQQMVEMQLIENLHRADLHPLEEASGYKQLIEGMGYDVTVVAEKISKSVSYVYQRLKLAALVAEAQQAFYAAEITAGHAILIARLQPADQERCLAAIRQGYVNSVRELMRWIEQRVHLDLTAAPFQPDDAALLPEAGACDTCAKRVGANPALFADLAGDEKKANICTDPSCYQRKIEAHIESECAAAKERGEPLVKISTRYSHGDDKPPAGILSRAQYVVIDKPGGRCPKARKAIVAEGDRTGSLVEVCADTDCKMHFRKAGGVVVQRSQVRTAGGEKEDREAQARQRAEREQQLKAAEVERRVRLAVAETVNSKLARQDVELVVASTLHRAWHADLIAAARLYKLDTKSGQYAELLGKFAKSLADPELNRFLVTFTLLQHPELLGPEAKRRKIDLKAIERSVGGNGNVAAKPAKVQTSPKPARRKTR